MFYLKLLPVNNILLYYLWMHKRKTVIFFLKFLKQQRIQHTRIMKVRKKIIERDIGSDTTLLCTYEPSLEFSLFGLLLTSFHSLSLSLLLLLLFPLWTSTTFFFWFSLSLSSFSQCFFAFFQIQLMLHIARCISNL